MQAAADPLGFFEREVRPLLATRCHRCHGPQKQKSGMRLDHISYVLRGGERGPAVVPGDPAASRIIEAIGYGNPDLQMPPDDPLDRTEIATLSEWVRLGAPWPDEPVPGTGEEPGGFDLDGRRRAHWAWQPVPDQPPPEVRAADWPAEQLDRFVLAGLENASMAPAPRADRETNNLDHPLAPL